MTEPLREPPLSVVLDTAGHTIERFPGDVLRITHTKTGRPVPLDEHAQVSKWFWTYVAVQGHDPEPRDPPIAPTPNTSSPDGWPRFPGDSER